MAQKVWIYTSIEYADGELEIVQELEKDRSNAEVSWGERVVDITDYLHNNNLEDFAEEKYDNENLYYEMRYNDDYCLVFVKEFEV